MNEEDGDLLGTRVSLDALIAQRFRARHLETFFSASTHRLSSGLRTSRARGRGIDFAETRAYEPGDDARLIDWRVTARTEKPHTKMFREERERPVLLLVDQRPRMFFGSRKRMKSVAAAQTAALLAWGALEHKDRVGGLVAGSSLEIFKPQRNRRTVLRFLGAITQANAALGQAAPKAEDSLLEAVGETARIARSGTLVVIISDSWLLDPELKSRMSDIARRCDLTFITIFDDIERNLPVAEALPVGSQFDTLHRSLRIDSRDPALRAGYESQVANQLAQIEEFCSTYGVPWFDINVRDPLLPHLVNQPDNSGRSHARRTIS